MAEKLILKMEKVHQQADAVRSSLASTNTDGVLPETLNALEETLEELHVAQEELIQSNAELEAARYVLEQEKYAYQTLFESAPDAYLVTNMQGIITKANIVASGILGYTKASMMGKPLSVFIHEDDISAFRTQLNQLSNGKVFKDWEVRLQSRQGQMFPAAISVERLDTGEDQSVGLGWIIRDVTSQVYLRTVLQENLEIFEKRLVEGTTRNTELLVTKIEREAWVRELYQMIKDLRQQLLDAGMRPVHDQPAQMPGSWHI